MYCVDCKKRVQVDTSKRSQCPDCRSLKVTEVNATARSRSQAPAQVAGRGKRPVARPGQRVNMQQRGIRENGGRMAPRREEVKQRPPAVNLRAKVPVPSRPTRPNAIPSRPEPRPAPRPEPRRPLPLIREEPHEQHRPRPLYPDSDSDQEGLENMLIQERERPGAMRRVRLIRISSPFEALELFHFLPQRQAAVLYFIMQGLGLFGIPQAEYGLGRSFEDFLSSIVSSQADSVHPASQDYLERMETAKITRDVEHKGEVCTICLAAFKAGEYANRLPCRHIFHGECVVPWLRTNNTCPVCRQAVDS